MTPVLILAGLFAALLGGVFLRLAWTLVRIGPSVGGQLYEECAPFNPHAAAVHLLGEQ